MCNFTEKELELVNDALRYKISVSPNKGVREQYQSIIGKLNILFEK